jgi:hypothetical protein
LSKEVLGDIVTNSILQIAVLVIAGRVFIMIVPEK